MILTIEKLSNKGEGVALLEDSKVNFSYLLPGDLVNFELSKRKNKTNEKHLIKLKDGNKLALETGFYHLDIKGIEKKSNLRREVSCKHYEKCGGCSLQHLSQECYYNFKYGIFKNAIVSAGFENFFSSNKNKKIFADIYKNGYFDTLDKKDSSNSIFMCIKENSRRRAIFKVNNKKLGFFEKESNNLVEIDFCPLLRSEINNVIPSLSNLLKKIKSNISEIFISVFDNGISIIFKSEKAFSINDFEIIKDFSNENSIISVSQNDSLIYQINSPVLKINDFVLKVPNNIFMQGTREGQDVIMGIIKENIGNSNSALDLYSGVGGYAFSIADKVKKITAIEGEKGMVDSIKQNIIDNDLNGKMTAEYRNLFSSPLLPNELNKFDLVIINPPRNGASPQCKNIAKSNIKKVIMVSCNPETFSVDSRILKDGGFDLEKAYAIDQFYWTPHLEIVSIFNKK